MKIILSPAKTLDYESQVPITKYSNVLFKSQAAILNKVLANKSPKQLEALMHISDKLAELNM